MSYEMGFRAEHWIFAFILLAGLMGGCGKSSPPPTSTSIRPGQTGELVGGEPPRSSVRGYEVGPPVIPLMMFFDHAGAEGVRRTYMPRFPHTPIVVTENAADEEFWEFEYRILAAPTSSMVGKDYSYYVIGSRAACEAKRLEAQRFYQESQSRVHTGPCIEPHYFKRIGPPSIPTMPYG
jgi:hypothetical protein